MLDYTKLVEDWDEEQYGRLPTEEECDVDMMGECIYVSQGVEFDIRCAIILGAKRTTLHIGCYLRRVSEWSSTSCWALRCCPTCQICGFRM